MLPRTAGPEEIAPHRGAQQGADDGEGGEPGEHLALAGARRIGHDGHGHGAVDRGGEAVDEADRQQGRRGPHQEIGKRRQREDEEAQEQGPAPADPVGQGPGRQLEEDAGDRGDAHHPADDLGAGPQVQGEEGQDRRPGQGIGEPGADADGAQGAEGAGNDPH